MFKTQVKPPTAGEWFHCSDVNIMTSFLWSVRGQTMENCCRFVFTITVTALKVHYHWRFLENRARDKDKKIEPPSCHFHGLHSYKRQFATLIFSATQLFNFFSDFFTQLHKLRSLRRSFLHSHFISAVHIWLISYIISTHFFHGSIWTHNWPAPNVSGFIAQLLEHRTGKIARSVTGSNPVEVLNFFQASLRNCINCVHCDDHFFISISFPQFICDLFHISLTLFFLQLFNVGKML